MALKAYKPTTPTRRHTVIVLNKGVKRNKPTKSLLKAMKYHAGRNFSGKLTVRHRGGREKRSFRIIDFLRDQREIPAVVEQIEYLFLNN